MNKELINKLIDDYVNDRLSSEEKTQLDNLLLESPDLKQELIMRKDISKGVEYYNNQELKTLLNKIHDEEIGSIQPKRNFWKIGLVSLGLLLITLLAYQLLRSNTQAPINTPELYASYYAPYNPSVQTRGEVNQHVLTTFYAHYLNKDYASAYTAIEGQLGNQQNETNLAAGICAMELNKVEVARNLFNKIITTQDPYFTDHATWYSALLFLKEADKTSAMKLLQPLSADPKADHHKEAKEILSKL